MARSLTRAPVLRRLLALFDAVALAGAAWTAHAVRFDPRTRPVKWASLLDHPSLLVTAVVGLWALAVAAELYEPNVLRRSRDTALRVAAVAAVWSALIAVATYSLPAWRVGRGLLALTAVTWFFAALVARWAAARALRSRTRPVALVVGDEEAVHLTSERLRRHPLSPWRPEGAAEAGAGEIAQRAADVGAEIVVIAGSESTSGSLAEHAAALHFAGVPVIAASEVWAQLDGRLPLGELSPAAFLHQPGFGAIHRELFNRFTRVIDVVAAFVMLVVALPIVALAALAILLFDGAPVLYRQKRLGQYGKPFTVLKLRTMRRDAEQAGPAFAQDHDPRATRTGAVLRRLRIDELPQLLNVLRGQMSLVGPRPERPEFAEELARTIPYYAFRLAIPPGLTGWAQVNMPYARTEEEHRRRLEYDLYFIRERSLSLYLWTLLRTLSAALVGAGE